MFWEIIFISIKMMRLAIYGENSSFVMSSDSANYGNLFSLFRDRGNNSVNETILHGVINSFVNVEEYKKKDPLRVSDWNNKSHQ